MGQRGEIVGALRPFQCVGLDTSVFIYHIEQTLLGAGPSSTTLRAMSDGALNGVTSVLRLLEVSIKPLRLGRPEVADTYELLLQAMSNLTVVNPDARTARIGAEVRAKYGLGSPDSLQIASCIAHGAEAFVTNDRRLRRVTEIEVIVLNDFV